MERTNNYNDLKPFRFWCQKVLPLVYDDSLSYYELLDKVIDYLNKTMEDVTVLNDDTEALYAAYNQLQSYVNSYFDNLDVQQEIDNKLDAMVLDGTLTRLVRPFVGEAVSDWLEDNVNPVGSAVIVDASLTIEGAAADAAAVGRELSQKEDVLAFDDAPTAGSLAPVHSYGIKNYVDGAVDDIEDEITDLTQTNERLDSEIADVKSTLGELIYSVKPIAGYKYIHIPIADSIATGVTIFSQALNIGTEISSVFLVGTWSNGVRDIIDLSDGKEHFFTTAVTYTSVEVLYTLVGTADGNTTYRAVCLTSADPISVTKELFNDKLQLNHISQLLDTPFDVPISEKFKGIIGFEFLITPYSDRDYSAINNQKYRITNIYYKDSFYLYMSMQRLVNGEWVSYDNITILLANAPTENGLMFAESNYQRFRVAYIPGFMQAGRVTNVEYTIKNTAINPFLTKTQDEFDRYVPYDSFEIKPTIKTRVTVKKDGTGDYTTISAAYSAISSKTSFFNQYEICVYPGTYEEYNLICPAYSHTHGMFPNTVTVTSEGKTGALPVFDQTGYPSRLSNMKIISATGYCIHIDNPLIHSVVNENLYCKKVYASDVSDFGWESISTSAIIGMGAQPAGMMIVFDGCTFENGAVVCHTNSSSDENADFSLVFNNCKVLNARIQLNKAGNTGAALYGNWLCKINNLAMIKGQTNPGIALLYGDAVSGMDYNFGWQIIGGNINTAIEFKKGTDTTAPDCWDNIELTEKSYVQAKSAITKGQWITDGMIPATANERAHNIIGVALTDASSGDTFPVWVGNAYSFTGTNGEYGIGSDGTLSASATEKIGKIINNIFYRY